MSFPVEPIAPLEAARQFIDKIPKPARILVAVSGGSDSTGLLMALHRVLTDADRRDITLHAVTIDHALRPESADEARDVATLCAQIGVPHHLRRWDAAKPASGLSAAARLARYALIGAVADEIAADMVVVGHTLGDQRETIAMRGARSTREDNLGLAGMADAVLYGGRHWIMRPFLHSNRQDIRDFLVGEGRAWVDDPSNDDAKYERVRTRNAPPVLDGTLIDRSIDRSALSEQAAAWVEKHVRHHDFGLIEINAAGLSAASTTLRYGLSALACVVGGRRFAMAADSMDRVLAFVMDSEPGRVTAGRVVFDRRKGALYMMRENRDVPTIEIVAGDIAIWDERFEVANRSGKDVIVRPEGSPLAAEKLPEFPPSVPAGVVRRAAQTLPIFERDGQRLDASQLSDLTIRTVLAPYDLFLPRFDLKLANAIALVFGRNAYPPVPV